MIEAADYPRFVPPAPLADRTPRDWTKAEAKRYRVWIETVLETRTDALLDTLGEDLQRPFSSLLERVGSKATRLLQQPGFCRKGAGDVELTDAGYALAADLGLLVARSLLLVCRENVDWHVVEKPKSDVSYNLPVLRGSGHASLEPVGGSVAEVYALLRGKREPSIWCTMYSYWKTVFCGEAETTVAEPGAIESQIGGS